MEFAYTVTNVLQNCNPSLFYFKLQIVLNLRTGFLYIHTNFAHFPSSPAPPTSGPAIPKPCHFLHQTKHNVESILEI